jgi:hypothetical protein
MEKFHGNLKARGHDRMKAMRPIHLTTKSCLSAAMGFALGVSLLAISSPARADDDGVPLDTKIFQGIMESLGLKSADEASIDYQERPPLVLPSNDRLPPPQSADAVTKNPAWPKDPDVARAKLIKKLERTSDSSDEVERESKPLQPDQMVPGIKYAPRTRNPNLPDAAGADGTKMTPSQLGYTGGLFKKMFGKDDEKDARFTGEPPRASLTQPPRGYQTPSPDQPYGNGKGGPPKASNDYLTRGEVK